MTVCAPVHEASSPPLVPDVWELGRDFSSSMGDFYARGNIRDIAQVIGIGPASLTEDYDAAHMQAPMPELHPGTLPDVTAAQPGGVWDDGMTAQGQRAGRRWRAAE